VVITYWIKKNNNSLFGVSLVTI